MWNKKRFNPSQSTWDKRSKKYKEKYLEAMKILSGKILVEDTKKDEKAWKKSP